MEQRVLEASLPISYRKYDAATLGEHLKNRHSVVLVGMKRVGINQFLRFFLYNPEIKKTYLNDGKEHLFIHVDLTDLVERDIFPFWTLTLKRIADAVQDSSLSKETKGQIENYFNNSIQLKDLFFTLENIRKSIATIIAYNIVPTIFFVRFDRIKDVVTPAFFDNLKGLRDATHYTLSYVFTSYRSLGELAPSVFEKASISAFAHTMFITPTSHKDTGIVFAAYKNMYKLNISQELEHAFFTFVDGHIQYLQYGLIVLREKGEIYNKENLWQNLYEDERVVLQSEELWESLKTDEQSILKKIAKGENVLGDEKQRARYLWDTGLVNEAKLFNPLFVKHIEQKIATRASTQGSNVEFTKKEHLLFDFLHKHLNEIAEREDIIQA
ncbi:MAG: hypothetical protein HY429_02745, partial [Candidatus Levybacteria bacterium]|nr:hypothetical protein [Candidatus Levybacteria bacterium]